MRHLDNILFRPLFSRRHTHCCMCLLFYNVADTFFAQVVFGNSGVLQGITTGKGYVDMSTVDVETAEDINEVC